MHRPEENAGNWGLARKHLQGSGVFLAGVRRKIPRRCVHVHSRISCRFTSGCFSQLAKSLDPCAVLHLLRSPSRVVFLLEPWVNNYDYTAFDVIVIRLTIFPEASVRFSARRALASSRMNCVKSWVRMVYVPWLEGSERRER